MLAQTGDFLIFDDCMTRQLQPMLATSWSHNGDGSVWTFTLRPGVRFQNGQMMSADDVVYTFQQQADPKNASNALSTFTGVLNPDGVVKVDDLTVAFHLEGPNGNFPYIISSDNYNLVIVPKGTDFAKWQQTFIGTGPFKLQSYKQNESAEFAANPTIGAARRTWTPPRSRSTRASRHSSWRSRAVPSTSCPVRGAGRRGPLKNPTLKSSGCSRRVIARCPCATTWRRSPIHAYARRSR